MVLTRTQTKRRRSCVKKAVGRLAAALRNRPCNRVDPITLVPVTRPRFRVVNENGRVYQFDPRPLWTWLQESGAEKRNPVTREEFNEVELRRLARLCGASYDDLRCDGGSEPASPRSHASSNLHNDPFVAMFTNDMARLVDIVIDHCEAILPEQIAAEKLEEVLPDFMRCVVVVYGRLGAARGKAVNLEVLQRIGVLIERRSRAFNVDALSFCYRGLAAAVETHYRRTIQAPSGIHVHSRRHQVPPHRRDRFRSRRIASTSIG